MWKWSLRILTWLVRWWPLENRNLCPATGWLEISLHPCTRCYILRSLILVLYKERDLMNDGQLSLNLVTGAVDISPYMETTVACQRVRWEWSLLSSIWSEFIEGRGPTACFKSHLFRLTHLLLFPLLRFAIMASIKNETHASTMKIKREPMVARPAKVKDNRSPLITLPPELQGKIADYVSLHWIHTPL